MSEDKLVLVLDDHANSVRPLQDRFASLGIEFEVISSVLQFVSRFEQLKRSGAEKSISGILVDMKIEGVHDLSSIGMPKVHTHQGTLTGLQILEKVIAPKQLSGEIDQVPVGIISAFSPPEGAIEGLRENYEHLAEDLFFFSKSELPDIDDNVFATFVNGRHRLYKQTEPDDTDPEHLSAVGLQVISASEQLLASLKQKPDLIDRITPRQFEEVVAELLDDQGWTVQLTPMTRDGGSDILAYLETDIGRLLCLVDAKRYRRDRTIGVGMIRELLGTLSDANASCAMMVTTSTFSAEAYDLRNRHEYRLSLKDFKDVGRWIERYRNPHRLFL